MASNQSSGGISVRVNPKFSTQLPVSTQWLTPVCRKAIEALQKLETDAAILRQEAQNMEQADLVRHQQALQRRLQLVSQP